jgi:hypothetical protein
LAVANLFIHIFARRLGQAPMTILKLQFFGNYAIDTSTANFESHMPSTFSWPKISKEIFAIVLCRFQFRKCCILVMNNVIGFMMLLITEIDHRSKVDEKVYVSFHVQ